MMKNIRLHLGVTTSPLFFWKNGTIGHQKASFEANVPAWRWLDAFSLPTKGICCLRVYFSAAIMALLSYEPMEKEEKLVKTTVRIPE